MKDYNQMAQEVFRRRDEYFALRKKKIALLLKAGVPLCSLVLVVLLGVTIRMHSLPEIPTKTTDPVSTTVTETDHTMQQTVVTTKPEPATHQQDATELQGYETIPFAPTDSVEEPTVKSTKPQYATGTVDDTVDAPACSPNAPVTPMPDSTGRPNDFFPEWDLPTDEIEPTVATASPTQGGEDSWYPSVDATQPPTTAPATGPLEVIVNGEKCVVQTGDMVTYTAELYVKDLFESFAASVVYSDALEIVEVVDPMEDDPAPVHYPNLTGGDEMLNYHYTRNNTDGRPRAFVLGSKLSGYNFKEQKVLLTFSFIAKRAGEAEIALEIHDLHRKGDGVPYFSNKKQLIFSGIACEEYITVTPADEVVLPTAPAEEEETAPPFTYPEESTQGELLVHADGRTYAADIGERITYIVELEAQEKIEYVNVMVTYGEILDLLVPEPTDEKTASEIAAPEIGGSGGVRFNEKYIANGQRLPAVWLDASRAIKFDFRRRKVLLQLDFIAAKAGEVDLDLIIQELTIEDGPTDLNDPQKFTGTGYFYNDEQLIFEGIEIYEYVIVH